MKSGLFMSISVLAMSVTVFTTTLNNDSNGGLISFIQEKLNPNPALAQEVKTASVYISDEALDNFIKNYDKKSRVSNLDCDYLDVRTPTRRVWINNNPNKCKLKAFFISAN